VSYLIDTNIISEIRKGERCDPNVSAWYASIADEDLFLSTLVLGEIRKGVELARSRDPDKAAALERWLRQVETAFDGRVLGIDNAVSDQWGRMWRHQADPGHRRPARGDGRDQRPDARVTQ
jgi:predicted nucleic acid-binding protein